VALTFRRLHPTFVAEVSPVDLRTVHDPATLAEIRAGMDEHAILVFRDQPFTDEEHITFACGTPMRRSSIPPAGTRCSPRR